MNKELLTYLKNLGLTFFELGIVVKDLNDMEEIKQAFYKSISHLVPEKKKLNAFMPDEKQSAIVGYNLCRQELLNRIKEKSVSVPPVGEKPFKADESQMWN